jgi:hypothetical protein
MWGKRTTREVDLRIRQTGEHELRLEALSERGRKWLHDFAEAPVDTHEAATYQRDEIAAALEPGLKVEVLGARDEVNDLIAHYLAVAVIGGFIFFVILKADGRLASAAIGALFLALWYTNHEVQRVRDELWELKEKLSEQSITAHTRKLQRPRWTAHDWTRAATWLAGISAVLWAIKYFFFTE